MKAEQHFEVILDQKMHLFCNFPATMQLPQLLMLQQPAVPVPGCPATQAEPNAAAPGVSVLGSAPSRHICNWKGGRSKRELEWN